VLPFPSDRGQPAPRAKFKQDGSSFPVALVCVGGCLGLLGVLLIGGGIVAALWTYSPSASDPSDLAPIEPAAQGEAPGLGALPLQELKAATVYVKVETANVSGSGSGFVMRARGDTAFVVTNHHVVSLPADDPPPARPPFGRRGPQPPLRPAVTTLTVVFRSGTPEEQSLPAAVVADNEPDDLAVLKVTGVRDVPRPIDCKRTPKLVETMPVLALGFPFGSALDPNRPNPAITVTKGSISSIRQDRRGELDVVQIDGDVNPGNSGGPLVDETGALVGVVVAKIKDSRIGFAVPVHKLNRLTEGRLD
jgi:S1-C subfamily serine protease